MEGTVSTSMGSITNAWIPDGYTLLCEWPCSYLSTDDLTVSVPLPFEVVRFYGRPIRFEVPKGFKTDLASDPLDRRGSWDYGSVVHDYLYEMKGLINNDTRIILFSRQECDYIFLKIMDNCIPCTYPEWKVKLMKIKNRLTYAAVRLFGGKASWRI